MYKRQPYIPICVSLCLALGFDSITGTAIVLCGGAAGFAGAFLNPYTEGVAQSIAGLPMFSGLGYRLVVYGCLVLLTITFVFIYARRVKKNPQLSPMYQIDQAREDKLELDEGTHPFGMRQKLILIALAITVGLLAYGTIQWGWYFEQIAGLFFGLGIVSAILGGLSVNQFANAMGRGMADIATGALVCGFARGIMAVSYTHLTEQKRQEHSCSDGCDTDDRREEGPCVPESDKTDWTFLFRRRSKSFRN